MRANSLLVCSLLIACGGARQQVRADVVPAETLERSPQRVPREQNRAARDDAAEDVAASVADSRKDAEPSAAALRSDIVAIARQYVGLRTLRQVSRSVPDDCTGFVRLVYEQLGFALMEHGAPKDNGVTAMWRGARRSGALRKRAQPGDIVFFEETYDRNRDGRRNDGLTHVGIAEEVLADGTVVFLHRGGKGVARSRFNLGAPSVRHADDGRLLNDYLRARTRKLRAYTAGELWAGAASAEAMR